MILRNYLQHYRYQKFKKNYQTIIVVGKSDLSPTPSWGTEKVHIEQGFVVVVPPGGRKEYTYDEVLFWSVLLILILLGGGKSAQRTRL